MDRPAQEMEFGFPQEWEYFQEHYQQFLEGMPHLKNALESTFIRTQNTPEQVDVVIFFLGRTCTEDFWEILLLCANGYGVGALKVLRGMYEKAVTAWYLHLHPDETQNFLDYYWVAQRKISNAIRQSFGDSVLPIAAVAETEENYQRVKSRFMVTDCKPCGTTRLNHTWSRLDFVAMAAQIDTLKEWIVPAYYIPTQQAHSTVRSIISRMEEIEPGHLGFDSGPQRQYVRLALSLAHNIVLNVLTLQKEHFELDALDLQPVLEDFVNTWKGPDDLQAGKQP